MALSTTTTLGPWVLRSSALPAAGYDTHGDTGMHKPAITPLWSASPDSPAMPFTGNWSMEATGNASMNGTTPVDFEKLLIASLGPRHRSLAESIILSIVYGAIFLTGVVGNVSTCIVITKNSYMHTATNYYLFSLAISDVLTLILGLPPELYTIWKAYPWIFGEPFCVFKIFLSEMTLSASVLTITAFTVERYVAICHPIKSQTMSGLGRAIKSIIAIWVLAGVTALPYPLHAGTFYYSKDPSTNISIPDSLQCSILPNYIILIKVVIQLSTFILFVAPMTIISVLYVLIGITLRKSSIARRSSSNCTTPSSIHSQQARRAVLKMLGARLRRRIQGNRGPSGGKQKVKKRVRQEVVHAYLVAVVVAFFICWAPFHAQRLMTVFVPDDQWTPELIQIQSILFYISGVLYFVSSTVNPILYNLMSRKYRKAFKYTMCRCCLSNERRLADRSRFVSDRMSNTYVTMTGVYHSSNDKSALLASKRAQQLAKQRSETASQGSLKLRDGDNLAKKDGKEWDSLKKNLARENGKGGNDSHKRAAHDTYMPSNGQVCNDVTSGKSDSPSSSSQTSKAATKDDMELACLTTAEEKPSHQVIRLKDHKKCGTYL